MTKVEQQCCPDFELRQQSVFHDYSPQMQNLILTQCHFADVRFPRTKKLDGGTNDASAVSGQNETSCAGLNGLGLRMRGSQSFQRDIVNATLLSKTDDPQPVLAWNRAASIPRADCRWVNAEFARQGIGAQLANKF